MEKVILFYQETTDIKISMQIYFNEKGQLIFHGHDIGSLVDQIWGDSDYEYFYSIEPEEVNKFYPLFNLKTGDKSALLQSIKDRFGVNEAYSLLGNFMNAQNIKYTPASF